MLVGLFFFFPGVSIPVLLSGTFFCKIRFVRMMGNWQLAATPNLEHLVIFNRRFLLLHFDNWISCYNTASGFCQAWPAFNLLKHPSSTCKAAGAARIYWWWLFTRLSKNLTTGYPSIFYDPTTSSSGWRSSTNLQLQITPATCGPAQ